MLRKAILTKRVTGYARFVCSEVKDFSKELRNPSSLDESILFKKAQLLDPQLDVPARVFLIKAISKKRINDIISQNVILEKNLDALQSSTLNIQDAVMLINSFQSLQKTAPSCQKSLAALTETIAELHFQAHSPLSSLILLVREFAQMEGEGKRKIERKMKEIKENVSLNFSTLSPYYLSLLLHSLHRTRTLHSFLSADLVASILLKLRTTPKVVSTLREASGCNLQSFLWIAIPLSQWLSSPGNHSAKAITELCCLLDDFTSKVLLSKEEANLQEMTLIVYCHALLGHQQTRHLSIIVHSLALIMSRNSQKTTILSWMTILTSCLQLGKSRALIKQGFLHPKRLYVEDSSEQDRHRIMKCYFLCHMFAQNGFFLLEKDREEDTQLFLSYFDFCITKLALQIPKEDLSFAKSQLSFIFSFLHFFLPPHSLYYVSLSNLQKLASLIN